jgi:hypothetical protein
MIEKGLTVPGTKSKVKFRKKHSKTTASTSLDIKILQWNRGILLVFILSKYGNGAA